MTKIRVDGRYIDTADAIPIPSPLPEPDPSSLRTRYRKCPVNRDPCIETCAWFDKDTCGCTVRIMTEAYLGIDTKLAKIERALGLLRLTS